MFRSRRTGLFAVLALVAALVLAGCGSGGGSAGDNLVSSTPSDAPDANVPIKGTDNGKVDKIAGDAISDIQGFWKMQMPKVFNGKAYQPVTGGFFSVDPSASDSLPPCATSMAEIKGNAFYCPSKDVVVWDRTGLLQQMIQNFGKYAAAMILAHEWGHAIQARSQEPGSKTIVLESQADCYSGAFTAYAKAGNAPHFHIDNNDLDKALAGYLNFADVKGSSQNDTGAHGNAFDRISAFQGGFENGAAYCASNKNFSDNRKFTELPYDQTSNHPQRDQSDNGNAPYNQAVQLGVQDLNKYYPTLPGWKPLANVSSIDPNNPASCGTSKVSQNIFYCPSDNTLYFDGSQHFPSIYQNFGDYAVQSLLATAYGLAYIHDQGKNPDGAKALLGAACYTGAYTYQVFAHGQRDHLYSLSPGDLDEAVQALLLGVDGSSFYGLQGTSGFDRVNAFQRGFQAALQVGFQGGAAQGATVCSP
ncbi:MAG TPA: neutral zinc metallopeptidase [Mycobacteriales bacterium]|nr:neutral zinc metallopeptidase [Mycobacteriales bacterium]